jgi:hypothetical protein
MKHVMIIGEQGPDPGIANLGEGDFRAVLGWLMAAKESAGFAFTTCSAPDGFVEAVRKASTAAGDGPIDRLDVYYHGWEGQMWMGEKVLFGSDATLDKMTGWDIAEQLVLDRAPLLSETALVRLLGCLTGAGRRGRMLLLKLAHHLGGSRVAFGPILDIVPEHFSSSTGRFTTPEYLFSSLGALDHDPPSKDDRDFETPFYSPETQRKPSVKSR